VSRSPEDFPVPVPDRDTEPFWDGCRRGELLIPRCAACGTWLWQPRPLCSRCHAPDPLWTRVSGDGCVASWTVIHPPVLPAWAEAVPFVVLLVELAEGPRLLGNLVDDAGHLLRGDGTSAGLAMRSRVRLRFRGQAGWRLPSWTLHGA
jgi:uncharacterized OB-fold protein